MSPAERNRRRAAVGKAASEKISKSEQLNFRIEEQTITELQAMAFHKGMPVGAMIRDWVLERLAQEKFGTPNMTGRALHVLEEIHMKLNRLFSDLEAESFDDPHTLGAAPSAVAVKKVPNRITEVVRETAKGFYDAGLMDQTNMHKFDALFLPEVPRYTAKQIQAIRARCKCNQTMFAKYMNESPSTLKQWEIGTKKPDGAACKLLYIIDTKGLEPLV